MKTEARTSPDFHSGRLQWLSQEEVSISILSTPVKHPTSEGSSLAMQTQL